MRSPTSASEEIKSPLDAERGYQVERVPVIAPARKGLSWFIRIAEELA